MDAQALPLASVHVIGRNRLQNDLLASFLEKETGLDCKSSTSLSQVSLTENGPGHIHLVLLDNESPDAGRLRNGEPVIPESDHNACLFALCNVEPDAEIDKQALEQGLRGIFRNNTPLNILSRGVQAILKGELWYSRKTLSDFYQGGNRIKNHSEPPVDLTFREKEVITRIVSGGSNQEIADDLNISIHTVKTHLYNIYKKINVANRLQAAQWAARYL